MMDTSHATSRSGVGDGDRLRKLKDRALGHVLSFLPAKEAARLALLSSRWRHVFGAIHTVSLEEAESPIPDYDNLGGYSPGWQPPPDPNAAPPFYTVVSAAIIARQRRRGAVPLRALRVAAEGYGGLRGDSLTVDQWVSYAVQQGAADGLDLDLRLCCRLLICGRPYALRRGQQRHKNDDAVGGHHVPEDDDMVERTTRRRDPSPTIDDAARSKSDDDTAVLTSDSSSDDDDGDKRRNWWPWVVPDYTATRVIFTCGRSPSAPAGSPRPTPSACRPW